MENRRSKRTKLMGEGREWKGGEGWGVERRRGVGSEMGR